ncbi:MAG TPA: class I SAM-dependent methyltransferase [Bdellovibrionales bacterium]|nr:class I SAM-dependent methyltransferase [Bdellovibrionales bacterium]
MLRFDPNDPFPLVDVSYADAKEHASKVDAGIGLKIEEAEEAARERLRSVEGQQLWLKLPIQTMLTPYVEIRQILHEIRVKPGQHVIDLGAGYGRMGFVIARHHPEVSFTGYEYVRERVEEGARHLPGGDIRLVEADLSKAEFVPADADVYFIYDYGTHDAIRKTLDDLRDIAVRHKIIVVGRGRASRDLIERQCPWLSQVFSPRHFQNFSIYRSAD